MAVGIAQDLVESSSPVANAQFIAIVDSLEQRIRELEAKALPSPEGDTFADKGCYVCNLSTLCWHFTHAKSTWPVEY